MRRSMYGQQMPVITAFIETDSSLWVPDQFILCFFQLEIFHVKLFVNGARIENKLVCGDSEKGTRQFPDTRLVKILQILTGQNQGGLLFTNPFEAVADVGNRDWIGEPQVQFVDGGHGISGSEQLVRHIGEHGRGAFWKVTVLDSPP